MLTRCADLSTLLSEIKTDHKTLNLYLDENAFGAAISEQICVALAANRSLKELGLSGRRQRC